MNVNRSFSYMFKDGSWFYKVFVGGLFTALGAVAIGIPFVLGYQVKQVRDMIGRDEDILPEWKNIAGIVKDGITVLCALALYIGALVLAAVIAGAGFSLTFLAASTGVVMLIVMPLVIIQFARRSSLLACLAVVTLASSAARHPAAFAATIGISFAVMTAVFALGWMSLIIGWPFVIFWGITVQTHIVGQFSRLQ